MKSADGILKLDKPANWTSFDAVNKVRNTLEKTIRQSDDLEFRTKRLKVGHSGTLDPFATGLLVIGVGKATKHLQILTGLNKTYEATLELGKTSSTGDPEGEVVPVQSARYKVERINEVLENFKGEIQQVPPAFSALKVNGKRAYELAREGKDVELKPRLVTIHELDLLDYEYPFVKIRCKVSKGTYIRTLAEDIGKALNSGAYLRELRRTKVGNFTLNGSIDPSSTTGMELLEGIKEIPTDENNLQAR